jgi:L-methionine (R)-S-oxide reductase
VQNEDADYAHIERTYDDGSSDYSGYFRQPHEFIEPERKEFVQRLPIGSNILDCGCGPGMDTERFTKLAFADVRHFHKTSRAFGVNCPESTPTHLHEVSMTRLHEELLQEFQEWSRTASSPKALMERISQRLHEKMTKYNWVGFYLVDPVDSGFLVVGPFVGSFTPNARIPLNKGLCGAAAKGGQVVVVDDVQTDPRYLSGSTMVKSEIVVPIIVNKLVAVLDIESYFPSTFNQSERQFVEACAAAVGKHLAGL